ncbi:MAG: 4-hydroxythreonine-4-phosphate dehydrogenase PdxA [Candidatus Saccharicenans sp.]|nr:MAG: 4-hydroxythreonine-4-phosphate dehydrogenase PdxA [Candidatus Aminicenantes bacterium]HEK86426.1 4-hydroxythreonine-4-phosphate dehydrogenase PdxA [Candidatus Aminicenantes bacterium]
MKSTKIGLTLGDPGGIGPEIVIRLLEHPSELPPAEVIIFGQRVILENWSEKLGHKADWLNRVLAQQKITIKEIGRPLDEVVCGMPSAENGLASFYFFESAVEAARKEEIKAMVTAPVSKTSWQLAGIKYRGHTEYLEKLYPHAIMSFWSNRLQLALFTHHLPLKEAIDRVKKESLVNFIINLDQSLKLWNLGIKEFLMCGLNPHAGEGGIMGLEEQNEIIPAVIEARKRKINLNGPFPPDTVFLQGVDRPDKLVICLYHDQGLIPFKLISFQSGVNLTLGMPFIRTSPDHGTAFDLAGKGLASYLSLKEALWLAWNASKVKEG